MQPLNERDPRQVGRYEILGRLGSGAMGRVFLGRGPDGRTAAIKLVHENLANEGSFRERFRREVGAARQVTGPRTAAVLDADPEAEAPWMAVEYVEGPNVEQHVRAHGPLAAEHIFWLAQGIALALGEIHRAGVIHRDLKPSNVLLSPTGPRVIDFGIARSSDASALTTMGLVTGSPAFMSPEQATSGEVTQKSDIFCLGAVLFFAATGRPVHGDGPPAAMLYRVVHNDPDLSSITDPELHALIEACLRKDPADRPGLEAIAGYASRPAGTRDLRMLAAPVPPRQSAYSPTEVIGPAAGQTTQYMPPAAASTQYLPPQEAARTEYMPAARDEFPYGAPTQLGEPAARPGPPAPPGGRRSSLSPALIGVLVVLLLIGGGILAVKLFGQNDDANTAQPDVTASSDTRPAETTEPPATEPAETTPAETAPSDSGFTGPDYLYNHTSGLLKIASGDQRAYNQDNFASQTSTTFRASCSEDNPWATTFEVPEGAQRVSGTLVLDPEVAPEDLEIEVYLFADQHRIGHWKLEVGEQRRFNENLRDAANVEISAAATGGECGDSVTPYGVIVDGAYT